MQWSDRIGRRLKPRDLHVFLAVAENRQHGEGSGAARHLASRRFEDHRRPRAHARCAAARSDTQRRRADDLRPRLTQAQSRRVRRAQTKREGDRVPGRSGCRRAAHRIFGDTGGGTNSRRHRSALAAIPSHDRPHGAGKRLGRCQSPAPAKVRDRHSSAPLA